MRPPARLESGAVVDLADPNGGFVARGLYDPNSPIAVRVVERRAEVKLDVANFAERIEHALRLRDELFAQDDATTAYRMIHGEGDRIPGLVVDRYGAAAVMRFDGDAMRAWTPRLMPVLAKALGRRGVQSLLLRIDAEAGEARAEVVHGPKPAERVLVREHGVAMEVDLWRGQKTGAFLDQRENRARVGQLARGKRNVLNLYSYAGGFSIAAALGGASRVTSVDSAAAAHATAQRTFKANGVDPSAHAFVSADVFAYLDGAHRRGERFDLVISDPPSFAPNERSVPRAISAYRKLHGAVARVLADGAVLCASSCSSHINAEEFTGTLDDSALSRSDLRVTEIYGPPADHPTLAAWPEGRYLKFVVLR